MYSGKHKCAVKEWGNEKWGNEEMVRKYHCANCWCFVTAVIKCDKKVNVHPCTHWEIIFAWQLAPKGYAMALHHGLQASSEYVLFTFSSWLEFLKFVESVNCLYFAPTSYKESFWGFFIQLLVLTYTDICLTYVQHYYLKQHVLNASLTGVHKMPVCCHSQYCARGLEWDCEGRVCDYGTQSRHR